MEIFSEDYLMQLMNLKEEGYRIIGVEQAEGSVELQNLKIEKDEKYALIFGHEVNGVDQEVIEYL